MNHWFLQLGSPTIFACQRESDIKVIGAVALPLLLVRMALPDEELHAADL